MKDRKSSRDVDFYQDVSRITLKGLSDITADFDAFYKELSAKFHPALSDMAKRELPEASDQLNAIVESTEQATIKIMDLLEDMQAGQERVKTALEKLLSEKDLGNDSLDMVAAAGGDVENCQSSIMTIFEELSFQDLTGQRIKRIVTLVRTIEDKVQDILVSLGKKLPEGQTGETKEPKEDETREPKEDKTVELKGPQRPGSGMDQTSVDDLISDLLD